ncbi:MAG TPA: hypothetical protein DEA08_31845 [Planctomycetes bacterium]|nr:hypothetical protein [Planctomycetota bacterium]
MWLARRAAALGSEAPYALVASLGLLLAGAALYRLAGGGWRGAFAAGLYAWAPLSASQGLRPMADSLAASLLVLATAALLPRSPRERPSTPRLLLGASLLGALCCAKPDHVLFLGLLALACARHERSPRAALLGALALLPWALLGAGALAAGCGGVEPAWQEGLRFLSGHVGEWGGLDDAATRPRALHALLPLGDLGPASPWAGLLGVALLGALALRAPRWLRRAVLLSVTPYALWWLFGQNLAHPRHALSLLPWLLLLAARGLPRAQRARSCGLLLVALALAASLLRSPAWREGGRPSDRLAQWLAAQPLDARLYAGGRARALRRRLPTRDVRRARDRAGVEADLAADPLPPAQVYLTRALLDPAADPSEVVLFTR